MQLLLSRLRGFVAVGPSEQDHWPALRMALGVGIPTIILLLMGRPELVIDAVFGGFAGMYGRGADRVTRLRHQSSAGGLLVAGVALGSALSAVQSPGVALVLGEALFAGLASLAADRVGFRPAGPFFALFAFGACAALERADPFPGTAVALASAVFALAIGASSPRAATRPPQPPQAALPSLRRGGGYAIAVAASGLAALAIGIGHPHWAMAGAAVPLSAPGISGRLRRGVHRVVGTLAGLCLTAAIFAFHPSTLAMGVLVVALQFPTELFMVRHYALALFFFTPLILLMTRLALPGTAQAMITDRAVETVLGVLIGFAVVLVDARVRGRRH
ncbi:FUSC family protein [Sinomonas terrae]|uniref:FUSC family protein n=1 Tax=Sinomonas terrae TaxID=2908838 RepID=A0ABS9U4M0_9MICC|nr:FUSC family protein [Sinomonas terrae]MCH6471637.1 FUSC family protein [Sinomonas terrae]